MRQYYNNVFRLLCLATAVLASSVAVSGNWNTEPYTAIRVEYDKSSQKEKRTKIYASKQGIREEELDSRKPAERQFTVVVNFAMGKTWFLVPGRKIYMEPPSADAPGVTTSNEPGTVLAPSPCQGYSKSEKRGVRNYEGRKVEEWDCQNDSAGTATQLYDPALQVVVRSESDKGHMVELRNITEGKQPDSLFKVPEGYRKASLREIVTGTTELPKYPETSEAGERKK
jgi:hypothetical protein